jgi:hypothetical protein
LALALAAREGQAADLGDVGPMTKRRAMYVKQASAAAQPLQLPPLVAPPPQPHVVAVPQGGERGEDEAEQQAQDQQQGEEQELPELGQAEAAVARALLGPEDSDVAASVSAGWERWGAPLRRQAREGPAVDSFGDVPSLEKAWRKQWFPTSPRRLTPRPWLARW